MYNCYRRVRFSLSLLVFDAGIFYCCNDYLFILFSVILPAIYHERQTFFRIEVMQELSLVLDPYPYIFSNYSHDL